MISKNSFLFNAVKWQSNLFEAGLPKTICTFYVRVFFTLVILPLLALSVICGWVLLPSFINNPQIVVDDYGFAITLWGLVCAGFSALLFIVAALVHVTELCENCTPVEYEDE